MAFMSPEINSEYYGSRASEVTARIAKAPRPMVGVSLALLGCLLTVLEFRRMSPSNNPIDLKE
jgi:hypothetical protein